MLKHKNKIIKLILSIVIATILFSAIFTNPVSALMSPEESAEIVGEHNDSVLKKVKEIVALWYYILWYFSIAAMLVVLIYLGIRIAISSIAEEKARYKRMLADWLVGMVIVVGIHYYMIAILELNKWLLSLIKNISDKVLENLITVNPTYMVGNSLYETVRTRAYEFRLAIGTSGMILYMVLVYYTVRFIIIYFKRFFTIMLLTIFAPLAALSYAFNKINTGKAKILTNWAGEYAFNVLIQSIHAFIYGCFVNIALCISAQSIGGMILTFVLMHFMIEAGELFRKIFKFTSSNSDDNVNGNVKENMAALTAMRAGAKAAFGSEMVQGAFETAKKTAGTIGNAGAYMGLSAYNNRLKKKNDELFDMQERSQSLEDEIENTTDVHERAKKEKEKEQLDMEIRERDAELTEKRRRLEPYMDKGDKEKQYLYGNLSAEDSHNQLERLLTQKKDQKRKEQIDEETQRRIDMIEERRTEAGRRKIADDTKRENYQYKLSKEEKEEIRNQVALEKEGHIMQRVAVRNSTTGRKEITASIGKTFKENVNNAIWKDGKARAAGKAAFKEGMAGVRGLGQLLVGMPLAVVDPLVGFGLLANGGKNVHKVLGNSKFKNATTRKYRQRLRNSKVRNIKNKKTYTYNRFTQGSLNSIKARIKDDTISQRLKKLTFPSLTVRIFTAPLKLTGIWGATRYATYKAHQIQALRAKCYEKIEISEALDRKYNCSNDFIKERNRKRNEIKATVPATVEDQIFEQKEETGELFEMGDKKVQFTNTSLDSVTRLDLIDNAIITIAAKNHVTDLSQLNLKNEKIQNQLVGQFVKLKLINTDVPAEEFKLEEEALKKLMVGVNKRVKVLETKEPEILAEKIAQEEIKEFIQEVNIVNLEDLIDNKEVSLEIADRLITHIDEVHEEAPKTEEEILEDKIENIVREVMETTTDVEEIKALIQDRVKEVVQEYQEETEEDSLKTVLEDMNKRREDVGAPILTETEEPKAKSDEIITEKEDEEVIKDKDENFNKFEQILTDIKTEEKEQTPEDMTKEETQEENKEKPKTIISQVIEKMTEKKETISEDMPKEETQEENKEEPKTIISQVIEKMTEKKETISEDKKIDEEPKKEITYEDLLKEAVEQHTSEIVDNVEDIISLIKEKDEIKQERVEEASKVIDKLIDGLEEVKDPNEIKLNVTEKEVLTSKQTAEEVTDELLDKFRTSKTKDKLKELDDELKRFENFDITLEQPVVTDEFIEDNASGNYNDLVGKLLAIKEQDTVTIDLKMKQVGGDKKRFMVIDEKRKSIYDEPLGVEDILKEIKKKQPNDLNIDEEDDDEFEEERI